MMKYLNIGIVLLWLIALGSFLSIVHAEDEKTINQEKGGASKTGQQKPGQQQAVPPKTGQQPPTGPPKNYQPQAVPPATNQQRTGSQMPNTSQERHGEEHHEAGHHEAGHHEAGHHEAGHHEVEYWDRPHMEVQHRPEVYHFNRERDYHHWNEREQTIWRSGVWQHEEYNGMSGWWWITGGARYFYERPIYPYPVEVPEVTYEIPVDAEPQPEYVQQPQYDPNYWYYCENPRGYYPYVSECPGGWMKVVPQQAPPGQ